MRSLKTLKGHVDELMKLHDQLADVRVEHGEHNLPSPEPLSQTTTRNGVLL